MGKPKCVREWKEYEQTLWDYQVGGEKWTVYFSSRGAHDVVKNDRGWGDPDHFEGSRDWSNMIDNHLKNQ